MFSKSWISWLFIMLCSDGKYWPFHSLVPVANSRHWDCLEPKRDLPGKQNRASAASETQIGANMMGVVQEMRPMRPSPSQSHKCFGSRRNIDTLPSKGVQETGGVSLRRQNIKRNSWTLNLHLLHVDHGRRSTPNPLSKEAYF